MGRLGAAYVINPWFANLIRASHEAPINNTTSKEDPMPNYETQACDLLLDFITRNLSCIERILIRNGKYVVAEPEPVKEEKAKAEVKEEKAKADGKVRFDSLKRGDLFCTRDGNAFLRADGFDEYGVVAQGIFLDPVSDGYKGCRGFHCSGFRPNDMVQKLTLCVIKS